MQPDARLDSAISYIAKSRIELATGKVIEMEGFQYEVEAIHNIIATMPKEEGKVLQPKVEQLLESLKVLEQELVAEQHKVQQQIFDLNRRQKALKSYETSSHSGNNDGEQ